MSRSPTSALVERQHALLGWSDRTRRDLPWRRTRDPWEVLVSELMLQQTQVQRVMPRFEAFLDRFADPASCAAAPVGEVIALWAGLGYNRRAVNLHRCAVAVESDHGGAIPDELDALLALPGIGPYTARAVLAFAFERDVGVLDTNAARVLARWEGRTLSRREAQGIADDAVPSERGWAWNQAMLDLGALACTARAPRCPRCPVASWCRWHQARTQADPDGGAGSGGGEVPDPAIGSAGVSGGQSRFEGSDRQGRGRLVDELRSRQVVPVDELARAAGWPTDRDRARRVAATLVDDGLARWTETGDLAFPT